MLTLDYQPATEVCRHCSEVYPVSRGSIFIDGVPHAIYLAGLHACESAGSVILGVGVLPPEVGSEEGRPEAFSIQIWLRGDHYEMAVLEPDQSPWQSHGYLGRMLTREEVLASPRKDSFFE